MATRRQGISARSAWRAIAFAMMLIVVLMAVALPVWKIGPAPVRVVIVFAFLALLAAFQTQAVINAIVKHRNLLWLMLGTAVIGTVISVINRGDLETVSRQVIEIHLQSAINLVIAAVLADACGGRAASRAFLIVIGITAIVAIAQYFDLQWSWDLRGAIGALQGEVFEAYGFFDDRRPMGVSYSPIVFGTQLCLGLAAFTLIRERERLLIGRRKAFDPTVAIAALAFLVVCFFSGNRSPILGGLIFLSIYAARRQTLTFAILGPVAAVLALLFLPDIMGKLGETGSRVASVDDKSAASRVALSYYGLLLFLDRPWGYGLDFDPRAYWTEYWPIIRNMPSASAVKVFPLHNYILNMLNFYGLPLFLLSPVLLKVWREHRWMLVFFIPYIVHILFHNTGPLWNDSYIWFVIAIARADTLAPPLSPAVLANRQARGVASPEVGDTAIGGLPRA
jgi:hypothetical protein